MLNITARVRVGLANLWQNVTSFDGRKAFQLGNPFDLLGFIMALFTGDQGSGSALLQMPGKLLGFGSRF